MIKKQLTRDPSTKPKPRTKKPLSSKRLFNEENPELSAQQQLQTQLTQKHGRKEALKRAAIQSGYIDVPPTIDEFLNDSYYFKSFLGSNIDGSTKWRPYWVEALQNIYPSPFYSPYLEVILTGCIGAGKSSCGLAGMAYDICHMLHQKSPHNFYGGLGDTTKLGFALINTTKDRAESVLFDQLVTAFISSPYFREQIEKAGNSTDALIKNKKSNKSLEKSPPMFPHRIDVMVASRPSHFIGSTVMGAILCELNFQTKIAHQAYDNYNETRRRVISRLTNVKSYPGRMWLDSSRSKEIAFLEGHIDKIKDDERTAFFSPALWEVKTPTVPYSGKTFTLFIGDTSRDPMIITEANQMEGIEEEYIIQVPVEHRTEFNRDLSSSIAELAGRTIRTDIKLISSVEKIDEALTIQSPIDREIIETDFFNPDDRLSNYVDFDYIQDKSTPRFIHGDLSIRKDRSAIGCTKIVGTTNSFRIDPESNLQVAVTNPVFVTEWVMYIQAKAGHSISITKIKDFVHDLRDRHKLNVYMFSTDSYQSENIRQALTVLGFKCMVQSVDRTRDPYDLFKDALLEGRWHGPAHSILKQELKDLIDMGDKIDHPQRVYGGAEGDYRGSKDGADTVAGSVFVAHKNMSTVNQHSIINQVLDSRRGSIAIGQARNAYESIFNNRDRHFDPAATFLPYSTGLRIRSRN